MSAPYFRNCGVRTAELLDLMRQRAYAAPLMARRLSAFAPGARRSPVVRERRRTWRPRPDRIGARPSVPFPPTPLVGREQELAQIQQRLVDDGVRLLTLTGPGGSGKTRLALAFAHQAQARMGCPAYFVDLSALRDPNLVLPSIVHALGVLEVGGGSLFEAAERRLADSRLLLVLDNFEQVLAAGGDLARLLERCSGLHVLATSREPLRLRWESELPVAPLPFPGTRSTLSVDAAAQSAAVALFVMRTQAVRAEFALTDANAVAVAEVCAALDGLPLAIELAAGWARVLEPAELLERFGGRPWLGVESPARDLPERHRSLSAAIAWSYDRLTTIEQTLFRRIAVFEGGCTLESAAAVVGDAATLEHIASLVQKNLLQRVASTTTGRPRYRQLETVRAFALDRLDATSEAHDAQNRHAEYFLALAEQCQRDLSGPQVSRAMEQFEREQDNLRAAASFAAAHGSGELELRLAAALWEIRWMRGQLNEAASTLEAALARSQGIVSSARARALHGSAVLLTISGKQPEAQQRFALAADLAGAVEDGRTLGRTIGERAFADMLGGDFDRAEAGFAETTRIGERYANAHVTGYAQYGLGLLALARGNSTQAIELLNQSVATGRSINQARQIAHGLANLALAIANAGDGSQALAVAQEALALLVDQHDTWGVQYGLISLAAAADSAGLHEQAAQILGVSDGVRHATGGVLLPLLQSRSDAVQDTARAALGAAAFDAAWSVGRSMDWEDAIRFALAPAADPRQSDPMSDAGNLPLLTPREREVALLIARGLTSRDIAESLILSIRTVDTHADRIRDKLGVRSRAEIAAWVVGNGLH